MLRPEIFAECENTLGESYFWHPDKASLWWTDIKERRIFSQDLRGEQTCYCLPERGCFILPHRSDGFIIGFPKKIVQLLQAMLAESICAAELRRSATNALVEPNAPVEIGNLPYGEQHFQLPRSTTDDHNFFLAVMQSRFRREIRSSPLNKGYVGVVMRRVRIGETLRKRYRALWGVKTKDS
ncbi:hypothetical protein GR212_29340 [Rhizobium lusitanum]|uniref:SMP-30/Gluconolactonase/LRE-like region domain-containing protein n=1 Tax=Rhizobium lusitanum TaxID=293958 RepID=A0A6L9UE77_9HYPH|nr:SMP-30/gluconolactonase/LRE family protein [Rhizobium lusitanum]NEI73661.1 hypothetical protein [Rhizobium lusitanum]